MINLIKRFKSDGKYLAEVVCSYCSKVFVLDATNINRTKSCGCKTNELIAEANKTHSAYSKYFPDEDLRRSIETITLINFRVKSPKHPYYYQICDFLNIDISGRLEPAKWLLNNFGVKRKDYSIERIDNSIGYVCGQQDKCNFCKSNNFNCNIAGFIPAEEQVFNKRNTTAFQLNKQKFCFNRLSEYVPINQNQLNYFWYRKHNDITKEERFEIMKEQLFKECDICKQIEMLN